MAGIIEVGTQSGLNLYSIIRNSSGDVWNGSAFVTYNSANWSTYAVTMTEQTSSGYYKATFPAAITTGKYSFMVHQRLGGSVALGDYIIGGGQIYWNGTIEEQTIGSILEAYRLDDLVSSSASPSAPTVGSFLDKILNKNGGQTFDPTTDSLEAIKDAGGGGPTAAQIADAVWDEVLDGSHATADSSAERLKAIDDKLPSGTISDFDESLNNVNLNSSQTGVTIGTVNTLGTTAVNQVASEMSDALRVDALSEPSAGAPSATPAIASLLMYLYCTWRNQTTESTSESKVRNNAGTILTKATLSDNGSEFTKGQYGAP